MTRLWTRLVAGLASERGQGTVEYFLVILAATALAIIALRWLQQGSGGGLLGNLFGRIIQWVMGRF
ncbi:MAG TPA: class III signal peptide-containing protein [Acidimicrobiia bacterium]